MTNTYIHSALIGVKHYTITQQISGNWEVCEYREGIKVATMLLATNQYHSFLERMQIGGWYSDKQRTTGVNSENGRTISRKTEATRAGRKSGQGR